MLKIFAAFLLLNLSIHAELLDKMLAVVDDKIITLSQVNRIESNFASRKGISPNIFNKESYNKKEIVELMIQRIMIRDRLTEMGYIISDDRVESEIKSKEKMLRLDRAALLNFLKTNNLTFDEFFELTRESIEFNVFISTVIQPLISVTEQEIKNTFYKQNKANKSLTFKYTLVDFNLPKAKLNSSQVKQFPKVLEQYQANGILPKAYTGLDTDTIPDIHQEDLNQKLRNLLKETDEGSFSKSILIGDAYHVYYVKKKDAAESEMYQRSKEKIRNQIFSKQINSISDFWYGNQEKKHYIKYFL